MIQGGTSAESSAKGLLVNIGGCPPNKLQRNRRGPRASHHEALICWNDILRANHQTNDLFLSFQSSWPIHSP
jgi:hypothetical protein